MRDLVVRKTAGVELPALIAGAGKSAAQRFLEFFTVNIRNRNTRAAYARAAGEFLRWCEGQGIGALGRVQPVHVAAYIELLQAKRSAPTVKQHLACIRMLFDWLVIGQVMPANPALNHVGKASRVIRQGTHRWDLTTSPAGRRRKSGARSLARVEIGDRRTTGRARLVVSMRDPRTGAPARVTDFCIASGCWTIRRAPVWPLRPRYAEKKFDLIWREAQRTAGT